MLIISSPGFERHVTPPGHPERPERAHVFDVIASRWAAKGGDLAPPRAATRDELELVHDPAYLEQIAAFAGRPAMLDADTFLSPDSIEVACLAAGAAVEAAEQAMATREPALALVRPPGHHAERDRAMGFCLFNSIAVAAAAAVQSGALERVAIVDVDVHHGNGTQSMFYSDPRVLYVSTHQYPFYPGTGAADEIGAGEGRGYTVNVPMEAGATDEDFDLVHRELVGPVLDEFRPQLLLISAGYDAHEEDPLASMRMTTAGYASVMRRLLDVSRRHGALAAVTEGGYDLAALAACLEATVAAFESGDRPPEIRAIGSAPRGARALTTARAALKPFWRGI
jgi:acetoin utilization deacetylase AcuC-like enzyme